MPATDRRFHVPGEVLSARAADATVLLDRRRGTYHTLNEVGARVWELAVARATMEEIVERILDEYDASRAQVQQDVTATLRRLLENGLVAPGERGVPKLTVPSVVRCGLLIAWFKALLRTRGFLGTLNWIRRRGVTVAAATEAPLDKVRAVEHAVAMAGAVYPGRARCLEQSLTLYYVLRRQGVAAVYCQGVQPYPFQAHAWIEYRGEVINDVPEHARFFARLPEQLP